MQKRGNFLPYFIVFLVLSIVLFLLATKTQVLSPVNSFLGAIFSPVQSASYNLFSKVTGAGQNSQVTSLKNENMSLAKKLIDQKKIEDDNKALRDQFETQSPHSINLLPADVVGAPGFIPGISTPESIIINRGEQDGVRVGTAIVYKDNLVGKVIKTSAYLSNVRLVTHSSSSFTVKTLKTNALGVLNGQGGGSMILNNVLLSDSLEKDDLVVTKGDTDIEKGGFSPDLIVGKITSVSKVPSDLFQKAEIKSLVDFQKLEKVFVVINP